MAADSHSWNFLHALCVGRSDGHAIEYHSSGIFSGNDKRCSWWMERVFSCTRRHFLARPSIGARAICPNQLTIAKSHARIRGRAACRDETRGFVQQLAAQMPVRPSRGESPHILWKGERAVRCHREGLPLGRASSSLLAARRTIRRGSPPSRRSGSAATPLTTSSPATPAARSASSAATVSDSDDAGRCSARGNGPPGAG